MGPKQRRVTEAGAEATQEAAAAVQARLDRIAEQLEHMQNLQTDEAQVRERVSTAQARRSIMSACVTRMRRHACVRMHTCTRFA